MINPNAGAFDKEQMLNFLLYHMTQETRQHLIQEMPGVYQRVTGCSPLTVIRTAEIEAMRARERTAFAVAEINALKAA